MTDADWHVRVATADWHIRVATAADADTLALVGSATFLETFAGVIDGLAIVAHCAREHAPPAYRTYLDDPRSAAWIAQTVNGAAPVGYALLTSTRLPGSDPEDDLELKRIYALSRFHGTGIGDALLREATEHAREQGAARLLLGTYARNHRAIAFYEKHGFGRIGTRSFHVGDAVYDDIVLAKPLT